MIGDSAWMFGRYQQVAESLDSQMGEIRGRAARAALQKAQQAELIRQCNQIGAVEMVRDADGVYKVCP